MRSDSNPTTGARTNPHPFATGFVSVPIPVIVIETDTFVTEDEANRDVIGRRDQAMNEVRDMVTEQFFKPSVDPISSMLSL